MVDAMPLFFYPNLYPAIILLLTFKAKIPGAKILNQLCNTQMQSLYRVNFYPNCRLKFPCKLIETALQVL